MQVNVTTNAGVGRAAMSALARTSTPISLVSPACSVKRWRATAWAANWTPRRAGSARTAVTPSPSEMSASISPCGMPAALRMRRTSSVSSPARSSGCAGITSKSGECRQRASAPATGFIGTAAAIASSDGSVGGVGAAGPASGAADDGASSTAKLPVPWPMVSPMQVNVTT